MSDKSEKEEVLTVLEVAKQLRISTATVKRLCSLGYFPGAFKVGDYRQSPWRIPTKSLEAFIQDRERKEQ